MQKYKKVMLVVYIVIAILLVVGLKTRYERRIRTDIDIKSESRIFDDANLPTLDEEVKLDKSLKDIIKSEKIDVAIVTTNNTNGKSSQEYAENFYTEHGFGYEKKKGAGVLLLIDMDTSKTGKRKIWMSTCGYSKKYITDKIATKICNNIKDQCSNGQYYDASSKFLSETESYMNKLNSFPAVMENTVIVFLMAAVSTGIFIFIKVKTFGMKVTAGASTYVDRNSVRINSERDIFLGKTVTTRVIERDNGGSDSGGSSGGGGSDFGGGGADF